MLEITVAAEPLPLLPVGVYEITPDHVKFKPTQNRGSHFRSVDSTFRYHFCCG